MSKIKLTEEQNEAISHLLTFPKQVQTLGGYAGTGKTTCIRELVSRLHGWAVGAYTGKASSVLRKKGVEAETIHSLIYHPLEVLEKDAKGNVKRRVTFILKPSEKVPYSGFVVDEASMVGSDIYEDLLSYGIPIIFVGDHGQLEPVGGKDFNLMKSPDVTLEKVHRSAGELARFAEYVRKGNSALGWKSHPEYTGGMVQFSRLEGVDWGDPLDPNVQVITAFNWKRVSLNKLIREALGFPPGEPCGGDRVMCLRNVRGKGLYNGMQGRVVYVEDGELGFVTQDILWEGRYVPEQFNSETRPEGYDSTGRVPFDYAYCVTCHKFQGDEADRVVVLEDRCRGWEHVRWAYTAASRARKQLVWVPEDSR